MGLLSKPIKTLDDLFVHTLQDIYYAEQQITKALPKMIKAATSEPLKAGFEKHLEETHGQLERLEQCFELLDEKVRGKACEAMRGIIEEASETMKEDMEPEVLDAALVASAQKVEHYEIASYGTVMTWAQHLGLDKVAKLLSATLDEEKAADQKLNQIAKSKVNRDALVAGNEESNKAEGGFAIPRSIRGAAERMGLVQDRPSRRRSSTSKRGRSREKRGRQ